MSLPKGLFKLSMAQYGTGPYIPCRKAPYGAAWRRIQCEQTLSPLVVRPLKSVHTAGATVRRYLRLPSQPGMSPPTDYVLNYAALISTQLSIAAVR